METASKDNGLQTMLAGLHVLVVDDESSTLNILATVLNHHGAVVIAVSSVREALEALQVLRPDIVLADIAMPGKSGFDLLAEMEALRGDDAERPRIPVVAVTAQYNDGDRSRLRALGFDDLIPKPVEPMRLMNAITRICRPEH